MFERSIDGARFGARTLFNARAGLGYGNWLLECWALNLSNERYVRSSASRAPVFFPTTPRPLDLISGDGRRFGVTLTTSY